VNVSFVIPTRNQARFIRTCIDSCLAQRVPGEIIVVDGASTDGTQEVLASYGDRIRFVSERDSGQSEALNKGVKMASGDVIAWINSDDFYPAADVLRRVLAAFAGDVDIVYGHGMMVDADGRRIRRFGAPPLESARDLLLRPSSIPQPAVFFRRTLFIESGGVDPALHLTMDYELWLRLFARARKIVRIDATLAHATYHEQAKSIDAMWRQIGETVRVKRRYQHLLHGAIDRLRLEAGIASLYAYWLATRLGLRRSV
jgi:GT2 family glycosyltransferase